MLRHVLLAASRSARAERLVSSFRLTRQVVKRYVADDVGAVVRDLTGRGLLVTVDHLGEEVADRTQADHEVRACLAMLDGLPEGGDLSVKLTALGLRLSEQMALDNAASVCEVAASKGLTVTLDAEEYDTVEAQLSIHSTLRKEHADVGVVVQAYLREAIERCKRLDGSRVRLCKGAYNAPEALSHTSPKEIDRSYVRCLKVLMEGTGYPMVATHDPRLIEIASALAVLHGRDSTAFEYQMLYGVRPAEQERLAGLGSRMRVYVPYGDDWYAYLMRRLAERPANLAFFVRSLLSRG
ncbi:proline dehydrogenase family protein [Nonomuraea africana]|uniref:proline dehydrogenase n=1 Tax=Nonomuraea africana TaxID=46171 RepID=A0ABR9KT20_9ACTN|nr:proline dehydrogenase family protein [Nonomuraea africana]MBE1564885.1 proline dehydrogenase [Nonomuraea africana]